ASANVHAFRGSSNFNGAAALLIFATSVVTPSQSGTVHVLVAKVTLRSPCVPFFMYQPCRPVATTGGSPLFFFNQVCGQHLYGLNRRPARSRNSAYSAPGQMTAVLRPVQQINTQFSR